MADKTILITGGAGFIGANFVRHVLASTDLQIVVVDQLTYAGNLASIAELPEHDRVTFIEADIADQPAMQAVFDQHKPDYMVNLAAETHVDRSIDDARLFIHTNVEGVRVLLDQVRIAHRDRPEFRAVHISTDEVYGSLGEAGSFSEATPYAPNSPYAASKAAADHLVRAWVKTYRAPVMITNCSNNYGPWQFPEKLIPLMVLNAIEGRALPVYGDGGHVRDWLYVEDHCAGILRVLFAGRIGEKYNIGGNNEKTNIEIVRQLCREIERWHPAAENSALQASGIGSYEDLITFVDDRPGHDRRYAVDASKIQTELDWSPAQGIDEGLATTVKWYLDNREWCAQVSQDNYDRERLGTGVRG